MSSIRFYRLIDDCPSPETLTGYNPESAFQVDYLRALEKSGIPGMSFYYAVCSRNVHAHSMFYFQLLELDPVKMKNLIRVEPYHHLVGSLTGMISRLFFGLATGKKMVLICGGNMLISGQCFYQGKSLAKEAQSIPLEVLNRLRAEIEKEGDRVIASVLKDFPDENDEIRGRLPSRQFSRFHMDPIMGMELRSEWKSFEDYLQALSAKYRQRYRKTIEKSAGLEWRDVNPAFIRQHSERLNELYAAVVSRSPIRMIEPDHRYLWNLKREMGNSCRIRVLLSDQTPVAFVCGLQFGRHYEAHHIGMDYSIQRSHNLYLNILYQYIEMAIGTGCTYLSFGRTALEMKTTVGAVAHPHQAYFGMHHSILHSLSRHFLPKEESENWTPRNPFRE